jgi:dihydroxyacetone kinase DhaKLM complex PTS-EIIA-like component DhaM
MAQHRVRILPAGGTLDGGLGTSIERVQAALGAAETGDGVLVLVDLGSAALVAELAIEQLPPERRDCVVLSPAPVVEGAVVAAVEAAVGSAPASRRDGGGRAADGEDSRSEVGDGRG